MKEYLEKRAVEHAVLHHSGDSAIVAVREIEPAQVIPVEYIREYIKNAKISEERAKQRCDLISANEWSTREIVARELLFGYSLSANLEKEDYCGHDE